MGMFEDQLEGLAQDGIFEMVENPDHLPYTANEPYTWDLFVKRVRTSFSNMKIYVCIESFVIHSD